MTRDTEGTGVEATMNETPKIYAFTNGGSDDWWNMAALSEDGVFLAGHICSHPAYGPHDMGVTSDWKHDVYRRYYPDGYEVIWVEDARTNEHLQAAHKRHLAHTKEEYAAKIARLKLKDDDTEQVVGDAVSEAR